MSVVVQDVPAHSIVVRVWGCMKIRIDRRALNPIASDDRILKEPEPAIALNTLADSSVNFNVRPWVKASDYWGVYNGVTEQVKRKFDEAGLNIPYPQTDVHVYKHDA